VEYLGGCSAKEDSPPVGCVAGMRPLPVSGSGCGALGVGFRVQGLGFGVQGVGLRVRGSGCGVQVVGFRV